jgi:ankyrin repeat protein
VKKLIANGADVNARMNTGNLNTPLLNAVSRGHDKVVAFLLEVLSILFSDFYLLISSLSLIFDSNSIPYCFRMEQISLQEIKTVRQVICALIFL